MKKVVIIFFLIVVFGCSSNDKVIIEPLDYLQQPDKTMEKIKTLLDRRILEMGSHTDDLYFVVEVKLESKMAAFYIDNRSKKEEKGT